MGSEGIPMVLGACCLGGMAFACALTISLNYATLLNQANDYDEATKIEGNYDLCGGMIGVGESGTGWTTVYKFNLAMYLIYTICFGASLICGPLATCFLACLGCTGIPMLACFILTGIRLLGETGTACRANILAYNRADELSFADDGELARKLWISQLATNCVMMCCGVAGIQFSGVGWAMLLGREPPNTGFKFQS